MAFNKMSNKEADRWQRKQDKMFERRHKAAAPKEPLTYSYSITAVNDKGEAIESPPRVIPEPRMSPYEIEWHQEGVQRRYRIMVDNKVDFKDRLRRRNGLPDEVSISFSHTSQFSNDFYYFVTDDGTVHKVWPHLIGSQELELRFEELDLEAWLYDIDEKCFYDKYWRWKKDHEPEFLDALKAL